MRGAVAVYCIAVGVLMAGWWTTDLRRGALSRGDRAHAELALHLVAEFVTAGWLVTSGAALLAVGSRAAAAAACRNEPGSSGARSIGDWSPAPGVSGTIA